MQRRPEKSMLNYPGLYLKYKMKLPFRKLFLFTRPLFALNAAHSFIKQKPLYDTIGWWLRQQTGWE